ncbi:uncharacterized protein LOC141855126 isoform X1 [Brevipalpus obovatus]|uniref:uncharacterized protein LOC141855126 isoform X1 n=1 Tax=Brevipalpus obovatus TaxID=246614 RepID=UPI003D9F984F
MILIKRRSSSAADVDQFGTMQVTRLHYRQKSFDEPLKPYHPPFRNDSRDVEIKNQTENNLQKRLRYAESLKDIGEQQDEISITRPPVSYRKTRAVSLISNQDQSIANIVARLSEKNDEEKVSGIVTKIRSLKSRKAKIKNFQAHRSKSLTQIDCIDPPSQRLRDGHGLAGGRGCQANSSKADSSPEAGSSGLNTASELHCSADRLVVPSLHHASSLGLDDRRYKSHHSSCEKNLLDDSGSNSLSQDGTLKVSKTRAQLARRSGGIFSNPFRTDREKMEQLTELLNQYDQNGIPDICCVSSFHQHSSAPTPSAPPPTPVQSNANGTNHHQHHHSSTTRLSDYGGSSESDKSDYNDTNNPLYLEKNWRALVDSPESMSKKVQNQQDAIWELLDTEVSYIKRLKVISDLFLTCLVSLQNECLLNDIDTERMFSNITQVYSANHYFWMNHLLPMLKASRENHQPLNPIIMKDGFLKFEDIFHPYLNYCLEHSNCLHYVKEKHKESELFKAYVVWCETRKDCDRLRLMDLLVKPMQRLTKYSLLLKAILKKTESDSQRMALEQMNESVERFVSRVDACLRHHSDRAKLESIVSRIESYDALDSSNDEVEKVLKEFCRLDLTGPMPGCLNHRIRHLILEGSNVKLKDSSTSSKLDVHCFLFTDILLICKSIGRKGDKVRVIRQPFLVDRIFTHELRDGSGFIVIYLNEFNVASAFFTLYTAETRTWLDCIRQAQDHYYKAKYQSAMLIQSAQSSLLGRSTFDGDDGDESTLSVVSSSVPGSRLIHTTTAVTTGSGLLAANSPRSSSLVHSTSGSVDISEITAANSHLGSAQMIAPSTTPNHQLLSLHYGTGSAEFLPSRATSFELGELRNPSMTLDDLETFGRSRSMETRTPSVTITSPRPERRAFLLKGAGGYERNSHDSFMHPMSGSSGGVNTLSVNVPPLHVSKHHHSTQRTLQHHMQSQQSHPPPSTSSGPGPLHPYSSSQQQQQQQQQSPLPSNLHQLHQQQQYHLSHHLDHEKSIQVPVIRETISQTKPPQSSTSSPKSSTGSGSTRHRSVSPRSLQRSLPVIQPINKPPLIKMKNIAGLRVHSAPPSEDPSPVHSFDSEQSCESSTIQPLSGSDGHIEMSRHHHQQQQQQQQHSAASTDQSSPSNLPTQHLSHHFHHPNHPQFYISSTGQRIVQPIRGYHTQINQSISIPQTDQQQHVIGVDDLAGCGGGGGGCGCDSDQDQAKSRLHQKRSVRGERRYHTADSIESMKKKKDTSIHKRLSWNYGQQQQQQSGSVGGGGGSGSSRAGHERLLCSKHFYKCQSSESVCSSSGFSSTGSVPLSVTNSSECEQCGMEILGHIQEIESTADSPTGDDDHEDDHAPSASSMDDDNIEPSDIKIDVSEIRDGISSVHITVSGANIGRPSKSELRKMKEFLLTKLEASEV